MGREGRGSIGEERNPFFEQVRHCVHNRDVYSTEGGRTGIPRPSLSITQIML